METGAHQSRAEIYKYQKQMHVNADDMTPDELLLDLNMVTIKQYTERAHVTHTLDLETQVLYPDIKFIFYQMDRVPKSQSV